MNLRSTHWAGLGVGLLFIVVALAGYTGSVGKSTEPKVVATSTPPDIKETDEQALLRRRDEQLAQAVTNFMEITPVNVDGVHWKKFQSEKYKFSLFYPPNYLLAAGKDLISSGDSNGSKALFSLQLYPNSPSNQKYLSGADPEREMTPVITVLVYKGNGQSLISSWVPNTVVSDIREIPGIFKEVVLAGQKALLYPWSGMYDEDAVVTLHGDFRYNFDVAVTEGDSALRKDFYRILSTVAFY